MFKNRFLPIALAALVLPTASGCSYVYHFDLTVTVVSAVDGTPVPDSRITPDFMASFKDGPGASPTDASGRHSRLFWVSTSAFEGNTLGQPWPLRIERDGFVTQTVNIKPATAPAKYGSTTPLVVTVRLEPAKEP